MDPSLEEGVKQQESKSILQQSRFVLHFWAPKENLQWEKEIHPIVLIFHFLFRTAALLVYIFGPSDKYVPIFVTIIILLAFDFWTVKNVSGRKLVGLRWWNEIKEDGSNVWVFESRENRVVNAVDSRMFWVSLYATPFIWGFFAFVNIVGFKFSWLLVTVVAIILNMANVIAYSKCEKDAKKRLAAAGNSFFEGAVNSFISNRIGNMFSRT